MGFIALRWISVIFARTFLQLMPQLFEDLTSFFAAQLSL